MSRLIVVVFLFFFLAKASAATFTVVSTADSGTGTLRWAITEANNNGTSTLDFIRFNLPGSTLADISIALETELPILTSNIVIDGTTQLFTVLSNPNIKINLVRVGVGFFSGLRLDNASNIEIYGISFSNFKSDPLSPVDEKKAGVFLRNSSDIIIGSPNKPNCFANNYAGILSPFTIPRANIARIKISSNIFGLTEGGLTSSPNEVGIDLSFLTASVIGGDTPEEGNLITSNIKSAISVAGADGNIKIANNVIGLDKTLLKMLPSINANGIYVNGEGAIPIISKNIVCGQISAIAMDFVNGGFIIEGNRLGTSITGNEMFNNSTGIFVKLCNKGMIGGADISSENKIAFNKIAVMLDISYPISILKNSIYCNSNDAVTFGNLPAGKFITQSRIKEITPTTISGQYLPNSVVELFYTDNCPNCQGKTWFATRNTDGAGNWSYTGVITGKVTSMGTNPDGATSNFSKPFIDNATAIPLGVVCGANTGSITIDVYDASVFAWYNVNNPTVVVGTERKLTNVGAGTYFLKSGQNGLCDVKSNNFTIDANANGINDLKVSVGKTYCSSSTGFIRGITVANDPPRTWYNVAGAVAGTDKDLENVPAGSYYFKTGTGNCTVTSKTYTIPNEVITYKIKQVRVVDATCGNSNGSIIISSYETATPTNFNWYDSLNNEFASTEDLSDLAPGKYRLVAYGLEGCTNALGEFTIGESTLPIIDYSALQKFISCDGKTISTSGINVSGTTMPFNYTWQDDNGAVVSRQLNLTNLALARYRLTVTDKNGCVVNGEPIDFTDMKGVTLTIPNSITPNGDGINDIWQIAGTTNYPNADFSIYNRSGTRVFYSRSYSIPFDGTFNGAILPIGVYYYVIDLKTNCDKLTGSLTIIR